MALIKNSNAAVIARDAVVLDLSDLRRQGEALLAQARARADQVLAEAAAERDRLVAGAAEAGRDQGLAEGLADGRARGLDEGRAQAIAGYKPRLESLEAAWTAALTA